MQSDLLQQMLTKNREKQLLRAADHERLVNEATSRTKRRHLGRKIVSIVVSSLQYMSKRREAVVPLPPAQATDLEIATE